MDQGPAARARMTTAQRIELLWSAPSLALVQRDFLERAFSWVLR